MAAELRLELVLLNDDSDEMVLRTARNVDQAMVVATGRDARRGEGEGWREEERAGEREVMFLSSESGRRSDDSPDAAILLLSLSIFLPLINL